MITIISSLLSVLIGVFVSSWFYTRQEKKRIKIDTARRLLGFRHHLTGEGFTQALNEAFIVFSDNAIIVKAIEELHVTATSPGKPDIENKLLTLLKAVCKDVNCLPDNINDTYFLKVFNVIKN
ncbi:MAG: hypothetical protein KJ757_02970 [Planctomycetes bacterium]|nr:hypothetical protein [Planctomycetota bacterium]MBU1518406.1 hypothetical protein [Planctomycetota bacterium]MBU2458617.1 hypothetical protein [Planctomycetota bacterium]MBU2596512.1 hypothetical protein [Planctomycetota bacterium]